MAADTVDKNSENPYIPPPTIDPTSNVKDLVKEVVIRMDALRDADRRLFDSEMVHVREQMELRAFYAEKLEIAEAKRIDAIRAVDVNAVAIANQRATDQAAVLAAQVQASAETLRVQLQQTAAIFKQQLDQTTQQLSDRISSVERSQYEGKGTAGSVSPIVAEQLAQLQESRYRSEGRSGLSAPILMLISGAVVGLIVFILQQLLR
jgi:hypothetical protein